MKYGLTPTLRRRLDRMIAAGAPVPDEDWDTMPSIEINRRLHAIASSWAMRQDDKRRAVRKTIWRTGDGIAGPGPRMETTE